MSRLVGVLLLYESMLILDYLAREVLFGFFMLVELSLGGDFAASAAAH